MRTTYLPLRVVTMRFRSGRIWCRDCFSIPWYRYTRFRLQPALECARAGLAPLQSPRCRVATCADTTPPQAAAHLLRKFAASPPLSRRPPSLPHLLRRMRSSLRSSARVAASLRERRRGLRPPRSVRALGRAQVDVSRIREIADAIFEHSFIDAARDAAPSSAAGLPLVDVSAAGAHASHAPPLRGSPERNAESKAAPEAEAATKARA